MKKIRNPDELVQAKADLAALEVNIPIYEQALQDGTNYQLGICLAIDNYIAAGGKACELFVMISHGIDSDLHPHAGCLIQLSYYSDDNDGGIKDDEYLFTGLIANITKAKYKEITRYLRTERIKRELIADSFGENETWDFSRPVAERLQDVKRFRNQKDLEEYYHQLFGDHLCVVKKHD